MRLVMPPAASIPLGLIFVAFFMWLLAFGPACALLAGFFAGYLAYDMTHYYVHHRRPKGPIGRRLRELHMRHHFQDHETGYGVSAPWWDRVFGTAPEKRE
jgi:sterol desaturase/sphingolipid hydroxylase (fatty acid hydroxylase superfamily)